MTTKVITDYEIFNWLNANMINIERLHKGKFALTYWDIAGNEQIIVGSDPKDCVEKACTTQ